MSNPLDKAAAKLAQSSKAMSAQIRQLDLPTMRRPAASDQPLKKSTSAPKQKSPSTNLPIQKTTKAPSEWKRPTTTPSTLGGKLYMLIEFLKQAEQPQSVEDIRNALRLDVHADPALAELVLKTSKIQRTEDGRYAYKPEYSVRDKNDLVELVKKHWVNGLGGLHVRDLKDQWKLVSAAIEELTKTQEILCIRTKDGKPIVLFYNDMANAIKTSEFEEFRELWKQFPIPDNPDDVQRELAGAGLKSLEVRQDAKGDQQQQQTGKRKIRRSRAVKITNTHLKDIDLTVDYPQMPRKPC